MTQPSLATLALERAEADRAKSTATGAPVRQVRFARRDEGPALHLGDLAITVRNEFRLADTLSDADILAALQRVAAEKTTRARWLGLFNSELGAAISSQRRDLNTAIGFILAQLPALNA